MSFNENQNLFTKIQNTFTSPIALMFAELSDAVDIFYILNMRGNDIKISPIVESDTYMLIKSISTIENIAQKYGYKTYLDGDIYNSYIVVTKKEY
jgi:hypothetical protein